MSEKNTKSNIYKYSDQKQLRFIEANNRLTKENKFSSFRTEFLQFKLSDLINSNGSFVIDHLYAQFQSNSNQISLFYFPPMENTKLPENSLLLSAKLLFNANSSFNEISSSNYANNTSNTSTNVNIMLADFYLRAAKQHLTSSSMDSYITHRLQFTEIILILFIISLWLISILFCMKRSSLVLCFYNRDTPFYDSGIYKCPAKKSNVSLNQSKSFNASTNNFNSETKNSLTEHVNSTCNCNANKKFKSSDLSFESNTTSNQISEQMTVIDMKSLKNVCSKCNKLLIKQQKTYSFSSHERSRSPSEFYQNKSTENTQRPMPVQTSRSQLHSSKQSNFSNQSQNNDLEYYYSNGMIYSATIRRASVLLTDPIKLMSSNSEKLDRLDSIDSQKKLKDKQKPMIGTLDKKRHSNLVSMDEEALLSYKRHPKFIKKHQIPASTNALIECNSNKNSNLSKKLNRTLTNKQGKLSMSSPLHPNFISLRSGSVPFGQETGYFRKSIVDDLNSTDNILKPPSATLCQKPRNRSSSGFLNNSSSCSVTHNNSNKTSQLQSNTQTPLNPVTSIRRHLFATSHRKAKTTESGLEEMNHDHLLDTFNSTANSQKTCSLSSKLINQDSNSKPLMDEESENFLNPKYLNKEQSLRTNETSKSDSNLKSNLHFVRESTKKTHSLQMSNDIKDFTHSNTQSIYPHSVKVSIYDELKNKLFTRKSDTNSNTSSLSCNNNTTSTTTITTIAAANLMDFSSPKKNPSLDIAEYSAVSIKRSSPSTIFDEPSEEAFDSDQT